ncbi:hypothetical protein FE634_12710 [Nocardioides dongxiaopingii]|uniref:hypothetical protein n=1 Tax=Nocardioides sp. S-1144 TaxID=2582905 RepID=UPI00110E4487|nr:hypothetical protein [Nocardioides sp. S-1144]QCW51048.1 hypothetical protein FE634_12710 [Nocardioides sp. S-1144]
MPSSYGNSDVEIREQCGLGEGVCYGGPPNCFEDGYSGYVYDVYVNGVDVDDTCVTDAPGEPAAPPQVTPGMVVRAFKALAWPASELTIQPPRGRTAVNFDTYFFTEDTAPITREVRLLGQRVTIEATPSEFTWHWGDTTVETTASPGGPHPRGDVVHQYRSKGQVAPSLDTTYTGRYRVNGGPWAPIPDTHTVPGPAEALEVVEVRPTLVGGTGSAYG